MRLRGLLVASALCAALALPGAALADSTGTVAGLRAQVSRLITAELTDDTATVCAIVGTPMNGTLHGKTCAQRWGRSIKHFLAHGGRAALHADARAVPDAAVSSNGSWATITLPHPLLHGQSRFSWYDNCWMLMS
jgi:hypothetical protein